MSLKQNFNTHLKQGYFHIVVHSPNLTSKLKKLKTVSSMKKKISEWVSKKAKLILSLL